MPIEFLAEGECTIDAGRGLMVKSVFEPISLEMVEQLNYEPVRKYLFQNVEVVDDTTKGQRNFMRNLSRITNQITI